MRLLAIALINLYQKFISPYKGFRCAHAVLHQGDSCSNAIKEIIATHGVFKGYASARQRLQSCHDAFLKLTEQKKQRDKKKKHGCYDCCDSTLACDIADCMPKHCDLPDLPCDCSPF